MNMPVGLMQMNMHGCIHFAVLKVSSAQNDITQLRAVELNRVCECVGPSRLINEWPSIKGGVTDQTMRAFINSMHSAYMACRNVSSTTVFTDPFIVTQISNTLYSMEVDVTLIAAPAYTHHPRQAQRMSSNKMSIYMKTLLLCFSIWGNKHLHKEVSQE